IRKLGEQISTYAPVFAARGDVAFEVATDTKSALVPGGGLDREFRTLEPGFVIGVIENRGPAATAAFHTPLPNLHYATVFPGHWQRSLMMHFSHNGLRATQV